MDKDQDAYVAENYPEEIESYRKYINQLNPNKEMPLQPTCEASSSKVSRETNPFPYNNDDDFFTSPSPLPVSTSFRRSTHPSVSISNRPNQTPSSFVTPLVQQSLDTPKSISLIDEIDETQNYDFHTPRSSRSPINDNQTTPHSRTANPLNHSDQNVMHTETTPIVKTKISQPHTSTRKKRVSSKPEDDFLIASMEASRAIADAVKENSNKTEQGKLKYYNFGVTIAESLESLELDLAEDAKFEIYNIIYQFEKKQRARQNNSN